MRSNFLLSNKNKVTNPLIVFLNKNLLSNFLICLSDLHMRGCSYFVILYRLKQNFAFNMVSIMFKRIILQKLECGGVF